MYTKLNNFKLIKTLWKCNSKNKYEFIIYTNIIYDTLYIIKNVNINEI